jgi:hypothetical protein
MEIYPPPLWFPKQRTIVESGARSQNGHVECGMPDWIREGDNYSSKRSCYCEIPEPFASHAKKILDMPSCMSSVFVVAFDVRSCCRSVEGRLRTWAL